VKVMPDVHVLLTEITRAKRSARGLSGKLGARSY
jgi:hypothetical protein